MQIDDGVVALRADAIVTELRIYDHVPDPAAMPPYSAVALLVPREPGAIEVRLTHGALNRRQLRLVARVCREMGYRRLLAAREEGRGMPLSTRRDDGLWAVDLNRVEDPC